MCLKVLISQIAKFMGPTWGPPGSCRPQMGPMLAPWTLLPGMSKWHIFAVLYRHVHYRRQTPITQLYCLRLSLRSLTRSHFTRRPRIIIHTPLSPCSPRDAELLNVNLSSACYRASSWGWYQGRRLCHPVSGTICHAICKTTWWFYVYIIYKIETNKMFKSQCYNFLIEREWYRPMSSAIHA